ncbi:DUF421 domain-containing protein [Desulfitobacterium sp. Sab5]|uniref:DUF421 domain-containing protein n=1 Tax=Desulfitobacterium TaxID=36853 RepID=UPI003CEAEA7F
MLIVITRTLILYALVVIALRLMGKREIGQLQPFDLVIILMISELAAIPSENVGIPLIAGIIPILVLLLASILLSTIELKSERARAILNGTPSILIERGRIIETELKRNRYNLNDLLEELRIKNVPNIADVEFAVLETNGQVSVLPKSLKRPTTPEDFNMSPSYEGLPTALITDGKLNRLNMQRANKDIQWLQNELKKQNLKQIDEVLLASLDTSGNLFIQAKQKK